MSRKKIRKIQWYCGIGLIACMIAGAMVPESVGNYVILGVPVFLLAIYVASLFSRCPCCGKKVKLYGVKECPKCGTEIPD